MKTTFFIVAFLFIATALFSQDPTVKIKLNDEERFRFEDCRLEFVNPLRNVLIGDSCGWNIDGSPDAVGNVFIGYRAGFSNGSGPENIFIGDSCGYNNQDGSYNTMTGAWAGWSNTSGTRNTFYGLVSGQKNTSGHRNSYFGAFSGSENDTGYYNCFFGHAAGYSNTGSNNTFFGKSAGYGNKGNNSVMIGFRAGMNDTASNKLYVSNSETDTPLIYGEFDNKLLRFHADRMEIRNPRENTFIGDSNGVNNSGIRNILIGFKAGYSTQNTNDNIIIGDSAGYFNTTGGANLFIGSWTGWSNISGSANVFIGHGTGPDNQDGEKNTMVGVNAGFYNTSGNENVFLGVSAGAGNTIGSCNTYLGRRAGLLTETGDSNVFIGYYAGAQETASHRLYIANSNTTTPLIYGEFDNELLRVYGTLDIKGLYHFPTVDGSIGQVLKTDGSGNLGWTGDIGATEINDLTDGKAGGYSVFLGTGAGANDDGSDRWNVAVGHTSLLDNVSGMFNTAVGGQSLMNNEGSYNTATGYQALFNNSSAGYNTAGGAWALYSNTSGGLNCSFGYASLYTNDDGYYNTAIGTNSLYNNDASYNTAVGCQSLYMNSDGENNTAVGVSALLNNTNGNYNTVIGNGAMTANLGGSGNTVIGYMADYYNQYGSNNTILGYEAGKSSAQHNKTGNVFIGYKAGYHEVGDDRLYIANSDTTAPLIYGEFANKLLRINGMMQVGAGQPSNPQGILTIAAPDVASPSNIRFTHGTSGYFGLGSNINQDFEINKNGNLGPDTETLFLIERSTGNVGIGTADPNYKLHLSSDNFAHIYLENSGDNESRIYMDANRLNHDNHLGIIESRWNGTSVSQIVFFSGNDDVNKDEGYISFFTKSTSLTEKMRISQEGNVGVNNTTPTAKMDINGSNGYNQLRMRVSFTPSSTGDTRGNTGDIAWDDNYVYIKTSAGWKRSSLETWP